MNLNIEEEALGGFDPITGAAAFTPEMKEHAKASLVDFLLELTDERVAYERAPFDHPEIFLPLDGTAPENGYLNMAPGNPAGASGGRQGFLDNLTNGMFKQVPASGAGGLAAKLPNFLNITSGPRLVGAAANCGDSATNHYCH